MVSAAVVACPCSSHGVRILRRARDRPEGEAMAATLLDLTQQGDVATISDESKLDKVKLLGPQQLYELWERQQWLSQEIDFSRDVEDWASLTDEEREWFVWGMSAFFVGEERVTTQFSGLVMAYEDEQEEAFLTTQQVDEARHMQFFDRFYREVVGMRDADIQEPRQGARGSQRRLREAVRRGAGRGGPAADRRSDQRRGEGRVRDRLPHGDRGHARPHRPVDDHRLLGEDAARCRASWRASGTWRATSTATSPTAPGT